MNYIALADGAARLNADATFLINNWQLVSVMPGSRTIIRREYIYNNCVIWRTDKLNDRVKAKFRKYIGLMRADSLVTNKSCSVLLCARTFHWPDSAAR